MFNNGEKVHLLVSEQYIDSLMPGATIKKTFPVIATIFDCTLYKG